MEERAETMPTSEARWERRVGRERRARLAAEDLLEAKSRELYDANEALTRFASELEQRVQDRTGELDQARERAVDLAERDQLTGVANRMRFGRLLDDAAARRHEIGAPLGLLLIDVDNFKQINDTLGHEAGDVFLSGLASRFVRLARENDVVARLGGDEFAIVAQGSVEDVTQIADRLLADARRPLRYREHVLQASCSIGIAIYPDDGPSVADLQRYADIALYKSKSLGRARWTLFDERLKAEFKDRADLGSELAGAIETGQVTPFFQPIVAASTGRIVGVEVLARWLHPTRGLLMPDLFIGLAEERGLTGSLFAHQLRAACLITRGWIDQGIVNYLSINVSPSQFRSGTLVDTVFDTLHAVGFNPSCLTIEITEDLLLLDLERARAQLDRLADGGVRISLDDFGTGYSNIAYLRRLPINTLKLDRLLTVDVCSDEKARSVLKAVVEIARALQLDLVAEGIESQAQARWLTQLGCEFLQGYLYGRPMSEQALLEEHRQASSRLLHAV